MNFVLVDRLLAIEPNRVTAATVFPPSLDLFRDHFPGRPVVPGTMITEAMGQAAGWLLSSMCGFARVPYLIAIDQAKFFRPVGPGENIALTAIIQLAREPSFEVHAEAHVSGTRVARARLLFRTEDLGGDGGQVTRAWARDTFVRLGGDRL